LCAGSRNPTTFMKKYHSSFHRGFTLVELLIVIAIIMVLAALGFAGVQTALRKAKTVQSLNIATNLAQSIQNYYDEYGALPAVAPSNVPISTTTGEGVNVLRVLLAQEGNGTNILNTRMIRFLDVKTAKARKAGLDYSGGATQATGLFDAWGEPYFIVFDDDYNDEIPNPQPNGTADAQIIRGVKSVIYSSGADRILGTRDDVRTW
jgi:prepilin-type N-terminal cleavage/methylation domain-containing protein